MIINVDYVVVESGGFIDLLGVGYLVGSGFGSGLGYIGGSYVLLGGRVVFGS